MLPKSMTIIYIDERGERGMEGERREMGRSKREMERERGRVKVKEWQ